MQFFGFGSSVSNRLDATVNSVFDPGFYSCDGSIGNTSLALETPFSLTGNNAMVLIHQTRGANVGRWEMNKVIAGQGMTTVTLAVPLTYDYLDDGGSNQAQIMILPEYGGVSIGAGVTLSTKPWDGNTGGILAFLCSGVTTVSGSISADSAGYMGGAGNSTHPGFQAFNGEGTVGAAYGSNGNNGNGGGGGFQCLGAGGGYATAGGNGDGGSSTAIGGTTFGIADLTLIPFGGAGGGGSSGTGGGTGGNGGGSIIIFSRTLQINTSNGLITSRGGNGGAASGRPGGAGAGGSIFIKTVQSVIGSNRILATGGSGATGSDAPGVPSGAGGTGRIRVETCGVDTGAATSPSMSSVLGGHSFCGSIASVIM